MRTYSLFLFLIISGSAIAQPADTTKAAVSGAVSVTNNGISLVPTFNLGKPAAVFDLSVSKKRFSFEPQFAFSFQEAKPWYFIFWLRYKVIETPKFKLRAGFHPGFVFSTSNLTNNSVTSEYFTTARYFVGELAPSYAVSNKASIGLYYLQSHGFNSNLKVLHFVGLNASFQNIGLGSGYALKAIPQLYYLKMDEKQGTYLTSTVILTKKNFPLAISSVVNQKIKSEIPSKDFVWNISLMYLF